MAALRRLRADQNRGRLQLGPEWQDTGLVFTTATGGPLSGSAVTQRFQRHLARSGLPRMKGHELRHGYATLMVALNESPKVIQEGLGHSSVGVTMNTYAHVTPAGRREAADRLGDLLDGGHGHD